MKHLHCPSCGTPFVRVTAQESRIERVLNRIKVLPFRCQLCTMRFHAFWTGSPNATQSFDRRQFRRLPTSLQAVVLAEHFNDVGQALGKSVSAYNRAVGSLENRILPAARKFKELGVSSDKDIPVLEPAELFPRKSLSFETS